MRANILGRIALASGIAFSSLASKGHADEYGFTTYPLGSLSFGAGITPPPGVYVTEAVSYYDGSIGGNFSFGGRTFNAGVNAKLFFDEVDILYVPEKKVFDGHFGFSVSAPAGYADYQAGALAARGTIITETQGDGLGDFSVQAQLGWDGEEFSHTFYVLNIVPSGRYERGFAPILGLNRPSLDLGWGFTYFDKASKIEINGAIGFMASLENNVTQYQTGNEFHAEWAIGYKFDNALEIGVVGYDYRQLTGDSGPGAILAPFIGSVDAVGGGLTYSTKIEKTPVTFSVRDYWEYDARHMFHGNLLISSFTAGF
ncbi:MAG: transporter [Rhodomicrobium sp.]